MKADEYYAAAGGVLTACVEQVDRLSAEGITARCDLAQQLRLLGDAVSKLPTKATPKRQAPQDGVSGPAERFADY